jgi:AAA+ ATPase superfamily predicted ATPase
MGQKLSPSSIEPNPRFIGREHEIARLREIAAQNESAIIVVHGRRRVGKTELIEQVFRERNLLKFEGIEGQDEAYQRRVFMRQLAQYAGDPAIASIEFGSWLEVFEYLSRFVSKGAWTLFFEELQWLSRYDETLVSELKYVWDNKFRRNKNLLLVLCGSAPSFMIGKVLKSKALHNRSMYELPLAEFSLAETREFFSPKRSQQEIMDAYLSVGGIPEYLKYLTRDSSVFLSMCRNSFVSGGFFSAERDRVFVSSLAKNKHYGEIVDFLANRRYATRGQIAAHLQIDPGGTLSTLLTDLELCGFIQHYTPFNMSDKAKLARYAIRDKYLQFYYKFVHPKRGDIAQGSFNRAPAEALSNNAWFTWLGYAFERYCRANHRKLAAVLGFSAVSYTSGVFYSRATDREDPGYQLDLVFKRNDRVLTLCEIKYLRGPAPRSTADEFERKLMRFPGWERQSIHKVLISAHGAEPALANTGYFDRILTLGEIFAMEA